MKYNYTPRSQEDKDTIIKNLADPFSVVNFLSKDEVSELIEYYENSQDRIHKNTGPITSSINRQLNDIDIFKNLKLKIKEIIGECEVYTGFYFSVVKPHIVHNDDAFNNPLIYKAITIPLRLEYEDFVKDPKPYPYLCMFDQYYLDGPAKFFNGASDIPTFYNKQVYEYSEVYNTTEKTFPKNVRDHYISHVPPMWLEGLSFQSAQPWIPGNAIVFDCARLHCASNFMKQGIKSKLGISIFTCLRLPTVDDYNALSGDVVSYQ